MPRILLDLVTVADIFCWGVCFWWMHRISTRQNAVLEQLNQQAKGIKKVSEEGHAMLSEVQPNVQAIQKGVDEVAEKVNRAVPAGS
ncbi:MAG TPA: hypothetical protein VK474_08390 [Chthoniobacterales bacterium]|nr:hypothetical protein [Chthoniobacterales bacterium]